MPIYAPPLQTALFIDKDNQIMAYEWQQFFYEVFTSITEVEGELLDTKTASASSSIDLVSKINNSYIAYKLVMTGVAVASDTADLLLRTSSDSGSTFDSGASDYSWSKSENPLALTPTEVLDGDDADTGIKLLSSAGTGSEETCDMSITIFNPIDTRHTRVTWDGVFQNSAPAYQHVSGAGARLESAAANAFRVVASTGNITSGVFKLYGIKS